ncbi:hypothetical protein GCM10011492_30710 [Flexivirga endophytica]|uniref:Uncharacterized protein n=1 Tax=Flexivirga endophytica TaxID=1849103 RepID=A0A916TCX1_9MICO|nr:hypothetical protein GCM10011492_30710 [Flexivirga endophytica]GHB45323.1 hypothetical protein GCM10008112_13100 [Flexivirga endophytica]
MTVHADYFSCRNCGLVLDNYELIDRAGIETTFEAQGDESDVAGYEGDYGND